MCPFVCWELWRDTPTFSFSLDAKKESSLLLVLFINKLLSAKKEKEKKSVVSLDFKQDVSYPTLRACLRISLKSTTLQKSGMPPSSSFLLWSPFDCFSAQKCE